MKLTPEQRRTKQREYMREYRKRFAGVVQEQMIDLTPSQCGYLAGYFDGEACLYIQKSRRTDSGYNYRVCIRFSQTKPEVIRWMHRVFGGSVGKAERNRRGYDEVYYTYGLSSKQSRRMLECIRPYVIEKREQVELAFEFFAHTDQFKLRFIDHSQLKNPDVALAAKVREEREQMYLRMRTMKVTHGRMLRDGPVKYSGPPLKLADAS